MKFRSPLIFQRVKKFLLLLRIRFPVLRMRTRNYVELIMYFADSEFNDGKMYLDFVFLLF